MSGHARVGSVEHRVLRAVAGEPVAPEDVAHRLGIPLSEVQSTLVRLVESGLADAESGLVWLSEAGRRVVAAPADAEVDPSDDRPSDDRLEDVLEVAASLGSAWRALAERASAERRTEADQRLASDAERDLAVHQLAEAFSHGRLSSADLEDRTGRALAARTHGDLDTALHGLGGLQLPVHRSRARAVLFWLITVLTSPFWLLGTFAVLFGTDLDARAIGAVLLLPTALLLRGLRRWSRPRPVRA